MRVAVDFQDEQFEFDVTDDRLVGVWRGPQALPVGEFRERVRRTLEEPVELPPLRQNVVPGDRVVIPIDPDVPDASRLVGTLAEVLESAGVETIRAVSLGPLPASQRDDWPAFVTLEQHELEPADSAMAMAYLANTQGGRRIYLNRALTEADVVVPVGLIGFDQVLGYRGPWSTLFPGSSDAETQQSGRNSASGMGRRGAVLEESAEVAWLLGSHFHVGVLPAAHGAAGVIAGEANAVREQGIQAIDLAWTFRPEARADLVIAGVGAPGRPTGLAELAEGLSTATGLVRRGGKIALLSRASGPIGPALRRLAEQDDPALRGARALRGTESEPDYIAARAIAEALTWADVYLLSGLDEDTVDGLSMIALGSPEEARRLAALSPSCLVVSQADRTRPVVLDESPVR